MSISRFEDLELWQESRKIAHQIFKLSEDGLFSKDFRFRDQIRSSSGSVMDNIAEGYERGGNREFIQFLSIAKGSCGETRSQVYRAFDQGYISEPQKDELVQQTEQLSRQIAGFIQYLKRSEFKGSKYH